MFVTVHIFQAVVELRERLPEGTNMAFTGLMLAFLSFLLRKRVNNL